jgi:hypothetical protein
MALLYVGAGRLEHLQYLAGDPLVRRFAGLARVPTARTVSNRLRRITRDTLRPLVQPNQQIVLDTLARLDVPRLTLDVDGTVVRTGATVAWAFRGFNPHHRKDQWDLRLRVMIYRKPSSTRVRRTSSLICSRRTTGTSSTTPSPPTWPCRCRRSTRSSVAGALRRRQSRNSRASSPSMFCRPATTEPTVRGSN